MRRDSYTRKPPLYHRYLDSGTKQFSRSGLRATLNPGDDPKSDAVTWLVTADALGPDIGVPQAGRDYMRDVHGNWWAVAEVGEPTADGSYPCRCTRWKEGGDDE